MRDLVNKKKHYKLKKCTDYINIFVLIVMPFMSELYIYRDFSFFF